MSIRDTSIVTASCSYIVNDLILQLFELVFLVGLNQLQDDIELNYNSDHILSNLRVVFIISFIIQTQKIIVASPESHSKSIGPRTSVQCHGEDRFFNFIK